MPDKRVRPSALTPIGNVFGLVSAASSLVLPKQYLDVLVYAVEHGIQVLLLGLV